MYPAVNCSPSRLTRRDHSTAQAAAPAGKSKLRAQRPPVLPK